MISAFTLRATARLRACRRLSRTSFGARFANNVTAVLGAFLVLLPFAFGAVSPSHAASVTKSATIYKDPQCGCCGEYARYLRAFGYQVKVVDSADLTAVKKRFGVPAALESCHTLFVDKYVIEGHVPLKHIERLLAERPAIRGIALPGMPQGSPGMGGPKQAPFKVYELAPGQKKAFAID